MADSATSYEREPDGDSFLSVSGILIEKNVPIPLRRPSVHPSLHAYPFHNMSVGDSFVVDVLPGQSIVTVKNRVANAARTFHRQTGRDIKITTRKEGDGNRIRCWRIG